MSNSPSLSDKANKTAGKHRVARVLIQEFSEENDVK